MHSLLTEPVPMDDRALQTLIGPVHKTPCSEGIAQCLAFDAKAKTASESRVVVTV